MYRGMAGCCCCCPRVVVVATVVDVMEDGGLKTDMSNCWSSVMARVEVMRDVVDIAVVKMMSALLCCRRYMTD